MEKQVAGPRKINIKRSINFSIPFTGSTTAPESSPRTHIVDDSTFLTETMINSAHGGSRRPRNFQDYPMSKSIN